LTSNTASGGATRQNVEQKRKAPAHTGNDATPIPRTLAMTIYGDLDVSVIDELPPAVSPSAPCTVLMPTGYVYSVL